MNKNRFYVKQINSNSIRGYLLLGEDDERRIPARLNIEQSVYNQLLTVLNKPIIEVVIDAGKVIGIVDEDSDVVAEIETTLNLSEFIEKFIRDNRMIQKNELYKNTMNKYPVSKKTVQRRLKEVIQMNQDILMNQMRIWVHNNE